MTPPTISQILAAAARQAGSIDLPLPHPTLSPNARVHWSKRAKVARNAKANGARAVLVMLRDNPEFCGFERDDRLQLNRRIYWPDKRRRDEDNCVAALKSSMDGVCGALGIDDSQIARTTTETAIDRANPRVEIEICRCPVER